MKKSSLIGVVIIIMLSLLLSACSSSSEANGSGEKFLRIGTASMGGNFFPLGSAISTIISDHVNGYVGSAQATGGSAENANFLGTKEVELALVQSGTLREATTGTGSFDGRKIENMRGLTSIYFNEFHILVRKDADINSIEDIKGKKVAVGPAASGIEINTNQLLKQYGITPDDYNAVHGTRQEATDGLQTGQVDVHIYGTGVGSAQVSELLRTGEIKLLPMSQDAIDKMIEEYPDFGAAVIPAGTYENQEEDIPTVAGSSVLVAHDEVDEEVVYNVMKQLYENKEDLISAHQYFKQMNTETATNGMVVELHPGAEKYLKEVGAIK
jgi:uncharacterized protein